MSDVNWIQCVMLKLENNSLKTELGVFKFLTEWAFYFIARADSDACRSPSH